MAKERSMELREELKQFLGNTKKEIKQLYEKIKQHPLTCLICIIFIVTAVVLLIALPYWRVAQFGIPDPKDLAEMENSYRVTLAQILGGIAVGIGVYFAWENLTTAREGQITERFTRAVDQLGNKELAIKLGGIYALERISKESEKDYWPIMEILTAYVRMNSSVEKAKQEKITHVTAGIPANEDAQKEDSEVKNIPLDIQAVLTVLGRRTGSFNDGESNRLNLRVTDLRKADLTKANLRGASLEGANLRGAYLKGANLEEANLIRANLEETYLIKAHLEKANFTEFDLTEFDEEGYLISKSANLKGADLSGAYLEGVHLGEANLKGACLEGANLKGADLSGAYLEGAYLEGAILEKTDLRKADLRGTNLREAILTEANLMGADLRGAYLTGADLRGTDLTEADLRETKIGSTDNSPLPGLFPTLTIDQISQVKTLDKAQLTFNIALLNEELKKLLREKNPALFEELKDEP